MKRVRKYRTNLRCESCVAAIKPHLDRAPLVTSWEVDLTSPDKALSVNADAPVEGIRAALASGGYQLLGEIETPHLPASAQEPLHAHEATTPEVKATYFPLALLGGFLLGVVALAELRAGSFDWGRAMGNFMGAFFLAFSFFKLLDLRGFATTYRGYDVVAKRLPVYGYVYPFIELLLGAAYITGYQPIATNIVTLVVMSVSSVGVVQSLLKKQRIRCACLGTVFNLPMSTVTLVEDGLMIAMAAVALFLGGH